MGNLLFLRRSYAYRHDATREPRKARALPVGPERDMACVSALGIRDLTRTEAWLEGDRSAASVPRAPTLPVSQPDMSDRRSRNTTEQSYDADQFVRCAACWCWFDRSNSAWVAAHRGPLPHPALNLRTAWADEGE